MTDGRGGRTYYDTLTERCADCGWRAEGAYPNGERYEACRKVGYILHEPKEADCGDYMTPAQVEAYRERVGRKKTTKQHK